MSEPPPALPDRTRPPTRSVTDHTADLLVMTAVAMVAVVPIPLLARARGLDPGPLEWLAWTVLVVGCGAVYLRRAYPLTVTVVTLACSAAYYPLSGLDGTMLVTFAVALYTLAAEGRVLAASLFSATTYGFILSHQIWAGFANVPPEAVVLMSGWFIAVVAIGAVVDRYRAYRREAGHAMTEATRRSAIEERLRIARELHDALGHNLSLIKVQAAAALRKLDKDPRHSPGTSLAIINDTSQEALRELRAALGVLRQVDEESPLHPSPGLAQLPSLVASAHSLGLTVVIDTDCEPARLPAPVDAAAYRIIQEALTNVSRHAGTDRAEVTVGYRDGSLRVAVDDDGVGGQPAAGGGMTGMRERAEALSGTFSAGPREGGGFSVTAVLPTGEGS